MMLAPTTSNNKVKIPKFLNFNCNFMYSNAGTTQNILEQTRTPHIPTGILRDNWWGRGVQLPQEAESTTRGLKRGRGWLVARMLPLSHQLEENARTTPPGEIPRYERPQRKIAINCSDAARRSYERQTSARVWAPHNN